MIGGVLASGSSVPWLVHEVEGLLALLARDARTETPRGRLSRRLPVVHRTSPRRRPPANRSSGHDAVT
jgi:hypothetical protein